MKLIMTFRTIKFVTDSVADLPGDLIKEWDITVVPAFVMQGSESYADDGVQLVREEFYEMLRTIPDEIPTTAAMPPGMARDGIKSAFDKGADHVIILTTPAGLSGIYNSMRIAMRDFPEEQVTLIDSEQVSMGIAWQVLLAAEVAEETGDVDKTIAAIEQIRKHEQVYAVLTTLEFLRRSGRVSNIAASIGSLLGIKLVVQIKDGQILPVARVRTFGRALAKIAELITPHAPFDRLAIMHAINPDGATALVERLGDTVPPDIRIESICPAIGVHGGPGIVGVATVSKGWKDAIGIRNAS